MADLTSRLSARIEPVMRAAKRETSTPGRRPRTTVVIGRLLGVAFLICFLTGVYSHVLQEPPPWLPLFPQPSWLYRVTQGTHVVVGLGLIPLLLGKLWSVFPQLFTWPPITGIASMLERGSIAVLVSSSVLEVALGAMNISQWYPFPFSFRHTHWALAWVLIGSVALHIAIKLPKIVEFWRAHPVATEESDEAQHDDPDDAPPAPPVETEPEAAPEPEPTPAMQRAELLSRRGALIAVGASAGAITLFTGGQSIDILSPFNVLAPRKMHIGPQGLPVNRTALKAGVMALANSPEWSLQLGGGSTDVSFSLEELRAMPQTESVLPIACVEGWSQSATWGGVRLKDLLELMGAPDDADFRITSLQPRGGYRVTKMPGEYARDSQTLVALRLGGEALHIDHGYPARVMAPGRPGVLQTKWLSKIEVI